jgi:DNA-binding MarR family transcriptional regulator
MSSDPIDALVESWQRELPGLDVAPMATVARLNRLSLLVNRRIEETLVAHGSSLADFDVLSALRRSGAPYLLKPSELSRQVMLSPSGMTHRVDLLEAAGLVERRRDPANRRTMPVALTEAGVQAAEELVRVVVDVESEILGRLTRAQHTSIDDATRTLLADLTS